MYKIINYLFSLRTEIKQFIVISLDMVFIIFSTWLSFSISIEKFHDPFDDNLFFYLFIVFLALPIFYKFD